MNGLRDWTCVLESGYAMNEFATERLAPFYGVDFETDQIHLYPPEFAAADWLFGTGQCSFLVEFNPVS
jgi:hypothetical protein